MPRSRGKYEPPAHVNAAPLLCCQFYLSCRNGALLPDRRRRIPMPQITILMLIRRPPLIRRNPPPLTLQRPHHMQLSRKTNLPRSRLRPQHNKGSVQIQEHRVARVLPL